ncbi:MAG: TRC40/GET3/ArsA family transport-energizing ATPase [Desulfohalobiaceae bacterium]|nr:TRC40/GET3/ArsA family transport-energizing ATPase [Desulfohalobiaceae bacterium]
MHIPQFLSQEHLQLLFFGGKGGVGKTTCAAATALYLASAYPQKSFLLVSTDPAHSLSHAHVQETSLANLEIQEINAPRLLDEFKAKHNQSLKEIALRGTFLDEEDIDTFLHLSLPGLDELMAFLQIADLANQGGNDLIIVDTAPTGHTLRLMGLPALSKRWLQALDSLLAKSRYMQKIFKGQYSPDHLDSFLFDLSSSVDNLHTLMQDRERFRFVPVMLAEELSIYETELLLHDLKDMHVLTPEVIINAVLPEENECVVCQKRRKGQLNKIRNIHADGTFSDSELWAVPQYAMEMNSADNLRIFWEGVFAVRSDLFSAVPWGQEEGVEENCVYNPQPGPGQEMQLLLVAGKGGVGKTTLAAATSLRLGRDAPDKKILVFSTDPAHSLSACFQQEIGSAPRAVAANVTAMEIDAQAEFDQLKAVYQEELEAFLSNLSANMDLTFDREVMERVLDLSPPGLDEVMALLVATEHMDNKDYDLLILDCAPTGHLIRLLQTPEVIDEWLKAFFNLFLKYKQIFRLPKVSKKMVRMSKLLKKFRTLLQDEGRSALIAVSILTEMALAETRDLMTECAGLQVNVPVLFCNMATRDSECPLCHRLFEQEQTVKEQFEKELEFLPQTVIYRCGTPEGTDNLVRLGDQLFELNIE